MLSSHRYPEQVFYERSRLFTGISYGYGWSAWHQLIALPVDGVVLGTLTVVLGFVLAGLSYLFGWVQDHTLSPAFFVTLLVLGVGTSWLYFRKVRPVLVTPFAHYINQHLGIKPGWVKT